MQGISVDQDAGEAQLPARPSKIIARSREPLVRPEPAEREGYVPNVVYTCGGLVTGRRLVLPYGVADSSIAFCSLDIDELVGELA